MPGVPLIVPDSSSADADVDGLTLRTYRQRLARTLGYFATGTVTTQAASLEAERYVISSAIRSDSAPPEHWDGLYVSITSGAQVGECRKLIDGGYEGTNGVLTVEYPFAAALATGVTFEIAILPANAQMGCGGSNDIINEALEQLPIIDYVTFTATATDSGVPDTEYSLAGLSWPVKDVKAVYYYRQSTTHDRRCEMPRASWNVEQNAESPILSFRYPPANTGQTFEVKLHRPANTRIATAGVWGDSTTGLANDSDAALYDVLTVVTTARPIALQRMSLMYQRGSKERRDLEAEAATEQWNARVARFYGGFRGNGAQKVGAR